MGWTQAICVRCWNERNPERPTLDAGKGDRETCCYCGAVTRSGIYVRVDPSTVPHPQEVTS